LIRRAPGGEGDRLAYGQKPATGVTFEEGGVGLREAGGEKGGAAGVEIEGNGAPHDRTGIVVIETIRRERVARTRVADGTRIDQIALARFETEILWRQAVGGAAGADDEERRNVGVTDEQKRL